MCFCLDASVFGSEETDRTWACCLQKTSIAPPCAVGTHSTVFPRMWSFIQHDSDWTPVLIPLKIQYPSIGFLQGTRFLDQSDLDGQYCCRKTDYRLLQWLFGAYFARWDGWDGITLLFESEIVPRIWINSFPKGITVYQKEGRFHVPALQWEDPRYEDG